jgi:hypothetical protein
MGSPPPRSRGENPSTSTSVAAATESRVTAALSPAGRLSLVDATDGPAVEPAFLAALRSAF